MTMITVTAAIDIDSTAGRLSAPLLPPPPPVVLLAKEDDDKKSEV